MLSSLRPPFIRSPSKFQSNTTDPNRDRPTGCPYRREGFLSVYNKIVPLSIGVAPSFYLEAIVFFSPRELSLQVAPQRGDFHFKLCDGGKKGGDGEDGDETATRKNFPVVVVVVPKFRLHLRSLSPKVDLR